MKLPNYGYLLILLVSLMGMLVLDSRRKLALFDQPWRTLVTLILSVGFFVAWDIAGIGLHIFQTNQAYVTGIYLVSPNLPLEELLLLSLITYLTLILSRITQERAV